MIPPLEDSTCPEPVLVLLAALPQDLDTVQELIHHLPPNTIGRIVVESAGDQNTELFRDVQDGLSVHVLESHQDSAPGSALCSAVSAWVAEWFLPDLDESAVGPHLLWVGGSGRPEVEQMCHQLHTKHRMLHMHHADMI